MEDFASAAMMRLIGAGLARQGLPAFAGPAGAHVPRSAKSAALAGLIARQGRVAVLRLADALPDMAPEPVLQALLQAQGPVDLFDRWHRLEVFSHARHRLAVTAHGTDGFHLTHLSQAPDQTPTEGETLIVVAVVTMLVEAISGQAVCLTDAEGARLRECGSWYNPGPLRAPLVLQLTGLPANPPTGSGTEDPGEDLAAAIRQHLATDPLRRWTVAEMARSFGLSPRTLQRRLTGAKLPFARLLADVRLQAAARLLVAADGPGLAQIGFLCGYSDQPHFTRSFTRAVGTTPAGYRARFRLPPAPPEQSRR